MAAVVGFSSSSDGARSGGGKAPFLPAAKPSGPRAVGVVLVVVVVGGV